MKKQADTPVVIAMLLGLVHAAFSLYWALGGQWLLETVGTEIQDKLKKSALGVSTILLIVTVFKTLAAVIPYLNAKKKLPWPKLWRGVSWFGSIFLVSYGLFGIIAGLLVLRGVIKVASSDINSLKGHVFLWDPLFLLWGIALLFHLWRSRNKSQIIV